MSESHVEIGGQRMTEAQYDAARRPLLDGVASVAEGERLREVWGRSTEDNPEHDPGTRPNHRPGSFLDKRDRRGMGAQTSDPLDPIASTTGATCLGNIPRPHGEG